MRYRNSGNNKVNPQSNQISSREQNSLLRAFIKFVVPSIAAMWVFSIYTMVDGYFVGKFVSETALASVNIAMPYVNSIFSLAIIIAIGTSTRVAHHLGAEKVDYAKKIFSFTILIILIFSTTLSLVSLLFVNKIAIFLGARGEILPLVVQYLSVIIWFIPFFMVSYHFEVLVKIDGFPRLATYGVLIAAISNIFLDWIFVGFWGLGIKGAALATGIAQVFSTIIFYLHFLKGSGKLKFNFTLNFRDMSKQLPSILILGTGDFLSELSTGFIVFLYNHFLLISMGKNSLVAYTVISYLTLFVASTMSGLTQGIQPLISFYNGKCDENSWHKILKYGLISMAGLSTISFIIGYVFPDKIALLFLKENSDTLLLTIQAIKKYVGSYITLGLNLLFVGVLVAIGRAKYAIFLSALRGFILIYIVIFLLNSIGKAPLIWYSSLISETVVFIIGLYFMFSHISRRSKNEKTKS
ncbi:MATE family efflux transporter [Eubacteriales bacterium KG127]